MTDEEELKELRSGYSWGKEYIELIGRLLWSIRFDFSPRNCLALRKKTALGLTKMLIREYPEMKSLKTLRKTIAKFSPMRTDGRYFREDYPYGYIGMFGGE